MANSTTITHRKADGTFKAMPKSKPDNEPQKIAKAAGLRGPKNPKAC